VDTHEPPAAGFRERGRIRRRARFLRKARELAYRDLGGLVFNLHRFGQRNDALVLAKLGTLTQIDSELRAIEAALSSRNPITVLREAGVTACPRCAAIHSGEDRFCPGCGLPLSRHVDLPISGAVSSAQPALAGAPQAAAGSAPQSAHRPPGAPAPGVPATAPAADAPAPPVPPSPAAPGPEPAGPPAGQSSTSAPTAPAAEPAAAAAPAPAARRSRHTPAPSDENAPATPSAGPAERSPVPPTKPKPSESGVDGGDEQPTQVFSSGAPSK